MLYLIRIGPGPGLGGGSGDTTGGDDEEEDTGRDTDPDDPAGPTDPSPDPGDDNPSFGGGGDDDDDDSDFGQPEEPEQPEQPEEQPEEEEPDPDAFQNLFVDIADSTIRVDAETTLDISAATVGGDFPTVSNPLSVESEDPSVAVVSGTDTVVGTGVGETDIVATVSGVDGLLESDVSVTVERKEVQVDQPQQPSDPAEFILPFGAFNGIPGVSGAQNISITIPQVQDITGALVDALPTFGQVNRIVSREVGSITIPEPPSVGSIAQEVLDTLDEAGVPSLTEVTATINAELRGLDIPSVDDITAPIDETISDVQQDINSSIDGLLTDIDQSIASVDRFVQDGIDGIQSAVDDVQDGIDTALEDIESGFSDVQDSIDEIAESIPSKDNIVSDTTDAVIETIEEDIIPTQEGVLLTDDPPRFFAIAIENFLQEALSESTKRQIGNSVAEER
jgi:hypothetical protein